MARRTSYSPNTALIAGEGRARKYQSGFAAEGAEAFTKGFLSTYEAGLAEKNKRDAKLDAAISKLNINSWHAMEAGANKQNVKIWARNQKDEYARLSEIYDKTKDRDIRDQMDAIEHAFVNLDSNIKGFTEETKLYVTAIDEKQLATKDSYKEYADLFDNIFTGSGEFSIEDNGGISFDGNNYSDITGKWNTINNTTPTHLLKTNLKAGEVGLSGKLFDRSGNKLSIKESIDASGPEATQALATQDLTGDDKYTIDEIGEVGDLSFKGMWESGNMNKKFYEDFPRVQDGGDSEWMWDKANSGKLSNLIAEYYTDVNEWTYSKNKAIYDIETPKTPNANDSKNKGNYKLGQGGRMYNPATGKDTWVGYKYADGTLQYDDEASLAAIKEHKEFPDAFQNIYKPIMDMSNLTSMSDPGKKGYNIVDGATGELILGEDNKPIFISIDEATRNTYGKTDIDDSKI